MAAPVAMRVLDFEDQPLGYSTDYTLDASLGISLILSAGFIQAYGAGITADASQPAYGFNTTAGGSKFLRLFADGSQPGGATAVFLFSRPQRSFGFYVTGVFGDAASPLTVELNDGEMRVFTVPDLPGSAVQFWGVVTDGAFSTVSLRLNYPGGGYVIGLDDVQVEASEPSTLLFATAGALWLAGRQRLNCNWTRLRRQPLT